MAANKRMATEQEPTSSSEPPLKKAAGKQRDPSPSPEPDPSEPAPNQPDDYPEPPEALFDAEIDLSATLATNAAAFQGDLALERHLQQWRQFAVTRLGEDQRVAVQVVAAFVEGERADERLTAGESSAARGSAAAAGPSDPLAARIKSIGELMGGLAGRGHNCLKVDPAAPRDSTAHRTLSVEDATLYVLSYYADQQRSALRGRPGDDARGGDSEGEGFGGVLPMVWAEQLKLWEAEGVDRRERHDRMRNTIQRCLPGLPVFVMKNGGRYLATSHLKYLLGMEKRAYELFRILRMPNRTGGSDFDSDDEEPSYEAGLGPGNHCVTAMEEGPRALLDPAPNKMVQALSTLAPTSSCEELADVVIRSAQARGDDTSACAAIAMNQVLALQGGEVRNRFRAAAIRAQALLLEAAMADGPPPEAFEEVAARIRAFQEQGRAAQAALADPDAGAAEKGTADSKGKRPVADERISKPGPGPDAESTAGGVGEDEEPGLADADYVDDPDPEAETDLTGDDWDRMRFDRPGFNPSAPVPIKTLGEISRFWQDFSIPDQVVAMQRHYSSDFERRYHGSHNLWTFKVLSNIMPVSRFFKSAPSSETFVAFELAKVALEGFGAEDDRNFGRSLSIAAYTHSEGVPVDEDMVHADGRDLLSMAWGLGPRGQGIRAGLASGSGAATGPATSEEGQLEQLRYTIARHDEINARRAGARVTMAAMEAAKERLESGGT